MISFNCDYNEGCHPAILEALARTNMEQTPGYGEDQHCAHAADLIREACSCPTADVHFLTGGTQTNAVMIAAALRPHQSPICADTGHINVHETGAVEASGHKVLTVPGVDGKITAEQVLQVWRAHYESGTEEHMAQPKLVYISQPTEFGTLYSKKELEELHAVCSEKKLFLYADGARLGYALAAKENGVSLPDMARLCDAFYIGGTKVGALFGEALVIVNDALKTDFRYIEKQLGAMLAKGRILGIQFETLFTDGLYESLGHHAVDLAMRVRDACAAKGWSFIMDSPTNQQFPIIPNHALDALQKKYKFESWMKLSEQETGVRICTSWATSEENIAALIEDIKNA